MPKLKTNKSVKKRFKLTSKGKVTRGRSGRRHLLTDKSTSSKRKLRRNATVSEADEKKIKSLLPYG